MAGETERMPDVPRNGAFIPLGSTDGAKHRLRGNMGVLHLLVTVLAFNAPLGAIAGLVPLVIGMGGGIGSPLIYLGYGMLMGIFAVGYATMGSRLPQAGAIYTFVTAGLGRAFGLSAAFVALLVYISSMVGTLPFAAMALKALVLGYGGPSIDWWVWVFLFVCGVAVLGVMRVDFSAHVLGMLVALEVIVVLIYDAAVVGTGGKAGHLSFGAFAPSSLSTSGAIIGLVFAVGSFAGFEATAVFRDEVRDPQRTIPRATYLAVAVIGIFYAVAAWLVIEAYGQNDAVATVASDPSGAFIASVREYAGAVVSDIATILMVTSIFAGYVALHNIVSRYLFVLGADGILPFSLGIPHRRFGSPYRASVALSMGTFGFFVVAVILALDPQELYTKLMGVAGYGLVFLLSLAAVGIAAYLIRSSPSEVGPWRRAIAPIVAAVALLGVFGTVTMKLDYLTGSRSLSVTAVVCVAGCVVGGCAMALVLRARRPETYRCIGMTE